MNFILKILKKLVVFTWNTVSYFFGFPYEQQARNLDLDKVDPTLRGPKNPQPGKKVYRPYKPARDKILEK